MPAVLKAIEGSAAGKQWKLPSDGEYTIGRAESCSISITDPGMSKVHCRVVGREDEWAVQDAGSKNGTFVNDKRIRRRRLEDGDMIRVGRTLLEFYGSDVVSRAEAPTKVIDAGRVRKAEKPSDE